MTYTVKTLQFNTKSEPVTGYGDATFSEEDTKIPIIRKDFYDQEEKKWNLQFVSCSWKFYSRSTLWPDENKNFPSNITANDGDIFKAWYSREGDEGDHNLSIYPFIIEGGSGEFSDTGEPFVDFEPHHSIKDGKYVDEVVDNTYAWYDTDTMQQDKVTATVHGNLTKFKKVYLNQHSYSTHIVIEASITSGLFDNIFVLFGSGNQQNNSITVNKNESCLALAVFKIITTTASESISTYQYPKIPPWEWQEISQKIITETLKGENGAIFEYLNQNQIIEMDSAFAKERVKAINNRIIKLKKLESIIKKTIE